MPIPITAPTTACVLDTGTSGTVGRLCEIKKLNKDCDEKRNKTKAWDITTTNAINGDIFIIPLPMVFITFCE